MAKSTKDGTKCGCLWAISNQDSSFSFFVCLLWRTFRIADFQQKIRPVASMDAVVVHQSRFALLRQRLSMDALDVVGRTLGAFWVESELVLAPGGTDRGH
jgi:hypothetical protein